MAVAIQLPEEIEQADIAAARSKGVPVDLLVATVLVSNVPAGESTEGPELIEVQGIPVLRAGRPLDASVVADTLDWIRRERDTEALGPR